MFCSRLVGGAVVLLGAVVGCAGPAPATQPVDAQTAGGDLRAITDVADAGSDTGAAVDGQAAEVAESEPRADSASPPTDATSASDAIADAGKLDVQAYPPCPDLFPCYAHGLCWLVNGKCVALTDKDCWGSFGRSEAGLSHAVDGKCVALSDSDCVYPDPDPGGPGWNEFDDPCMENGFCKFKNGTCVVPESGCDGMSELFDGHCDEKKDSEPGVPCAKTKWRCANHGRCTNVNGVCVNTNDADCQKSSGCKDSGRCVHQGEKCVAGGPADCANSENCAGFGQCTFYAGQCRALSDADCAKSTYKCCDPDIEEGCPKAGCTPYFVKHTFIGVACWGDKGYCRVYADGYCSASK